MATRSGPILTLREHTFSTSRLPVSTGWLLADCMEFRGKQDLWTRQKPELLSALRQQAMVQSVESSNRIEGVTVASERLQPLVLGGARPRDRSEEELSGYRRALEWIFSRRARPAMTPKTILHLHSLCQGGVADAGQYKRRDNEIIEFDAQGRRTVRFIPTSASQTPAAVKQLCESYDQLDGAANVPPLLLIATAVFDFLCIHPFRDGNGRVARLLATLLLQRHGFSVARYVSLERIIEDSKEDYYRTLKVCSTGWKAGTNEILPWWNFLLSVIRRGYVDLSEKVEREGKTRGKTEVARQAILKMPDTFTLADLRQQLPTISLSMLKVVLAALRKERKVQLEGRGRGATWRVVD